MRLDALFARRTAGIRPGVDHLRLPFAVLGRPCAGLPAIHIVGTNGKGSTAAMCEAALRRRGRRVGLYTSPHLVEVNERIRVNGEPIADAQLQRAVDAVLAAESGTGQRPLSFFEVLTLAALWVFDRARLDAIVVEAGLGGRLDATRLVDAAVVVVTSIALDHQRWLGDTLEEIAAEKAGVFVRDTPVLVGPVADSVHAVLQECANRAHCPMYSVLPLATAPPELRGRHQRANAALALAATCVLCPSADVDDLQGVRWPGRLERIAIKRASVWFDVGHNAAAIAEVVENLRSRIEPPDLVVVFGCTPERPSAEMAQQLRALGPVWWSPLSPDDPAPKVCARAFEGPRDPALLKALNERVDAGRSFVVVGSHQVVGPLRQWAVGQPAHIDPVDPRHAAL